MTLTEQPAHTGVDVETLFATIDAVKANPQIAAFRFRADNQWLSGTNSRTTIHTFYGAMQELTHVEPRSYDADHPAVLTGKDRGSTPVEFLLHALAACLTAGLANIAAARGVRLTEVTSTIEGDIDLTGLLGLDPAVRNGYQGIRVSFRLRGDDPEALRRAFDQSVARSAVLDVLSNGVPVAIDVDAG